MAKYKIFMYQIAAVLIRILMDAPPGGGGG